MENDEVEVNEILSTIENMADSLIYTEKCYKEIVEENDLSGIILKIKSTSKELGEIDKILDEKAHESLKNIDEALQKTEELLKLKQKEQAKLRQEFKQKQDYEKQCVKSCKHLQGQIETLEKQKEAFRQEKLKVLTYKLMTSTSFDYKTKQVCGCILMTIENFSKFDDENISLTLKIDIAGPNENVEPFKLSSDNSREKIVNTLWRKVKEVNEI